MDGSLTAARKDKERGPQHHDKPNIHRMVDVTHGYGWLGRGAQKGHKTGHIISDISGPKRQGDMVHVPKVGLALALAIAAIIVLVSNETPWIEYQVVTLNITNIFVKVRAEASVTKHKTTSTSKIATGISDTRTQVQRTDWEDIKCSTPELDIEYEHCSETITAYHVSTVTLLLGCAVLAATAVMNESGGFAVKVSTGMLKQTKLAAVALFLAAFGSAIFTVVSFNDYHDGTGETSGKALQSQFKNSLNNPGDTLDDTLDASYSPTYGAIYYVFIVNNIVAPAIFCVVMAYHLCKKPEAAAVAYAMQPLSY